MTLVKPSIFDTTTFDLTITGLDKTPADYVDEATGFDLPVYEVEWSLTATEGSDSVTLTGSTQLAPPDSSSFTNFYSLTNDIVKGWIIDSDPFIYHKYTCCNRILGKRVVVNKSVPW